ncbi:ABC transporter permease [Paenibacillus larvae]|uniref:Transport permease protein n=1 Tax=Paenibacillus larvae TaxID=1464 RepID=A0AAP5JR35_9BACL|nr:ABC transporter permease [Paenibacillus larvae]AQR76082.1 hypothetical protein BXP28_00220 [Paenibacillus larvae subsp. larvae]AVF23184.1 ABC transporter, efflux permease protein [Paenibacillus larvae subsp. larvae]ETK26141.1 ABC transporter, efflux permease protein [Paenibacillus larvae subsp. larvae DSM 25719]MCY7476668.1 ABC transporter permease [Paenibacillus larvae]MCY7488198.1 ABC transporter permease [Paenibacillus larvae]
MHKSGWFRQVGLLTGRLITNQIRQPFASMINLFISAFFFIVYHGALGGSNGFASMLSGGNYTSFLLPTAIIFATASGSSCGQVLVQDMETRYFQRLLSMPLSRSALILAPMLAGALQVLLQIGLIIGLGFALGPTSTTGMLGVAVAIIISFLWGMSMGGISIAVAMQTGNSQIVQSSAMFLFPLIFLSPAFLPREDMQDWMKVVSLFNPTTYILEGLRSLFMMQWEQVKIWGALIVDVVALCLTFSWALLATRGKTSPK